MSDIERYERAKEKTELCRTKEARLAGAHDEIMKRLKKEFGCATIEEAEQFLISKEKKTKAAKKRLEELLDQYEKEFPDDVFEGL